MLWDDNAHVTRPELRSLEGLRRIWFDVGATQQYYPLVHSAFWVQHRLWGDHTRGYHVVNLLLHIAAAGLVYAILRKLAIPGALLATALFALHPVQVETVAWISEQKNTLSAVFYLGAMLAYLHFDATRKRSYYALAAGLFVLGLLSKTVTATLPAALLVIFWWQRGTLSWRRDVWPLVPHFALGAAFGVLTAIVERDLIGAQGADFEFSLVQRSLLAGQVIWFYLGKLAWPFDLVFFYPRWTIDPADLGQWLYAVAAVVVLIGLVLLVRRKGWRGPLACWLFFVGTLFPVLGFLNVYPFIYSYVADHFQYLASLGIFVLAAALAAQGIARLPQAGRLIGQVAGVLAIVGLAVASFLRAGVYADTETLYLDTITKNPTSWLAYNNLGAVVLNSPGRGPDEALGYFEQSLKIREHNVGALSNLAITLHLLGRNEEAIAYFEHAIQLQPKDATSHSNFAATLLALGRFSEAVAHFEAALDLEPNDAAVHNSFGDALVRLDRPDEAVAHFREAVRVKPDFADAHFNLGHALVHSARAQGGIPRADLHEAISHLQEAVRLKPEHAAAHNNLGLALRNLGRTEEAANHLLKAVQLQPADAEAWANLSLACAQLQRSDQAVAAARRALELARAQGHSELAAQVEAWLATQGASQPQAPAVPTPLPVGPPQ